MDIIQANITVSGTVQGVGYRQACLQTAQRLNINGWVKNTPQRQVQILAQGSQQQLDALVQWAHKGPVFADVTDLTIAYNKADTIFEHFIILKN